MKIVKKKTNVLRSFADMQALVTAQEETTVTETVADGDNFYHNEGDSPENDGGATPPGRWDEGNPNEEEYPEESLDEEIDYNSIHARHELEAAYDPSTDPDNEAPEETDGDVEAREAYLERLGNDVEEFDKDNPEHSIYSEDTETVQDYGGVSDEPEAKEWPRPPREKPAGGYRIDGKFVSRAKWEAYMDMLEGLDTTEIDDEGYAAAHPRPFNPEVDADEVDEEAARHNREVTKDPVYAALADLENVNREFENSHISANDAANAVLKEMAVVAAEIEAEALPAIEDSEERRKLLAQLYEYVSICGYSQVMLNRASEMDTARLREYLETTRINSGGSITVAALLAQTEEQYAEFVSSPDVQRKTALIEAKGADFINMAQRLQRVMGNDVVVNGVKHREYHELLKVVVAHASVIDRSITSLADVLRITIPEQLLLGGERLPVVDGQPLGTKAAIYILSLIENNLRAWATSSDESDRLAKIARAEAEAVKKQLKLRTESLAEVQAQLNDARSKHEKATSKVLGYTVTNEAGEYLCIDDEDKGFRLNNLAWTDIYQEAISMKSRRSAQDLADRYADLEDGEFSVTPVIALGAY